MHRCAPRPGLLALVLACACGARPAPRVALAVAAAPSAKLAPARLVPDGAASEVALDPLPDGSRRVLAAGVRALQHPDGSVETAADPLPASAARPPVELPARLGGGVLFFSTSARSTAIWKAARWLDPLVAFAALDGAATEIVAGFDRVYVRLAGADPVALDAATGREVALALPASAHLGPMAFADAWRGLVVLDLRGPVVTFDAGTSWHPLPVEGVATRAYALGEQLVVETGGARVAVDARGELTRSAREPDLRREPAAARRAPRPLGEAPLRAAVEDGWPLDDATAVVARGGALARVSLADGRIASIDEHAYPADDGACHAVAFGVGVAFACGAEGRGTALFVLEAGSRLALRARYARPRAVAASGEGGLLVRGPCAPGAEPGPGAAGQAYCVLEPRGLDRQVVVPERDASERVAVLADGRVACLVPPRGDARGKLRVVGAATTEVALDLAGAALPAGTLWLDGLDARGLSSVAGWVETGGRLRGVEVGLDGHVTLAKTMVETESAVVAGRWALASTGAARGSATYDGGATWQPIDLPIDLAHRGDDAAPTARACGPVGCALPGWLRVGWGPSSMRAPPAPPLARAPVAPVRGHTMRCAPTGEAVAPTPDPSVVSRQVPGLRVSAKSAPARSRPGAQGSPAPSASARVAARPPPSPARAAAPKPAPSPARSAAPTPVPPPARPPTPAVVSPWASLRGAPPPRLDPGERGLDAGTDPPATVAARVYAWGPRTADWGRTGRWQARFDDRFALDGVRSTAVTVSAFADEDAVADAFGLLPGAVVVWSALLDASGRAAALAGCRGSRCELWGARDGVPLAAWRGLDLGGRVDQPVSMVRAGATDWLLAPASGQTISQAVALWRVDAGVARLVTKLARAGASGADGPRLVRRARGEGLGVLLTGVAAFGHAGRDYYVVPLDETSGAPGEPQRLASTSLDGVTLAACAPDDDGWLVDTMLSPSPALRGAAGGVPDVNTIELRLRLDPGRACVEAMAARGEGAARWRGAPPTVPAGLDVALVVSDPASGARARWRCAE